MYEYTFGYYTSVFVQTQRKKKKKKNREEN